MEDEGTVYIIEEKVLDKNEKIFKEVLEEVQKETNNYHYDRALAIPSLLRMILKRERGREILKQMIIDSQRSNYELEWARGKAFKLASYINYIYTGSKSERVTEDEFKRALATFEIHSKVVESNNLESSNGNKKLIKIRDKK